MGRENLRRPWFIISRADSAFGNNLQCPALFSKSVTRIIVKILYLYVQKAEKCLYLSNMWIFSRHSTLKQIHPFFTTKIILLHSIHIWIKVNVSSIADLISCFVNIYLMKFYDQLCRWYDIARTIIGKRLLVVWALLEGSESKKWNIDLSGTLFQRNFWILDLGSEDIIYMYLCNVYTFMLRLSNCLHWLCPGRAAYKPCIKCYSPDGWVRFIWKKLRFLVNFGITK